MSDDLNDDQSPEEEPDPDAVPLDEDALDEDVLGTDHLDDDDGEVLVEVIDEVADDDDEGLDLEEELHPDDVEEPLDVLLLERTSSGLLDEEEYDEDDELDSEGRAEPGSRIHPKRPGEFVCRSCFLVKHPSQLADPERVLCRDCL